MRAWGVGIVDLLVKMVIGVPETVPEPVTLVGCEGLVLVLFVLSLSRSFIALPMSLANLSNILVSFESFLELLLDFPESVEQD